MNKILVILTLLFLTACSQAPSQQLSEKLPENRGRITDNANVLSYSETQRLASKLKANEIKFQAAVLIVKSLEGKNLEDFSHDVFNKWKLGTKEQSNGILLLLAMKEKGIRIQTGTGTETKLVNIDVGDIIDRMKPCLVKGKFYNAIDVYASSLGRTKPEKECKDV